jgi:hypothetical protein
MYGLGYKTIVSKIDISNWNLKDSFQKIPSI